MIKIETFDIEYLSKSWNWLNDNEIRELTMTPKFTQQEQIIWFNSLSNNKNYFIKGIKYDRAKVGVVGLKNITKDTGEYFGYIGEKKYWGLGIGKYMLNYIENHCKEIGIKKIYLKVLKNNKRAFLLYKNFNYTIVKDIGKIYIMEKEVN